MTAPLSAQGALREVTNIMLADPLNAQGVLREANHDCIITDPLNAHGVLREVMSTADSDPNGKWVTVIKGAKRWNRSSKENAHQSPMITGPLYYACAGPEDENEKKNVRFKPDSELVETFFEETDYMWYNCDASRKPDHRRSEPARYVDVSLLSKRINSVLAQVAAI